MQLDLPIIEMRQKPVAFEDRLRVHRRPGLVAVPQIMLAEPV